MMEVGIAALVAGALVAYIAWLGWVAYHAPTCGCDQPDCGGGCL